MSASHEARAGFTLLEALIALTMLAGTTASVMMLIGTNRRAQALAEADLATALNARTLLGRIGRDLPLVVGTQSGSFDDGQDWSVQIAPHSTGNGGANLLFEVRIRLRQRAFPQAFVDIVTLKEALP